MGTPLFNPTVPHFKERCVQILRKYEESETKKLTGHGHKLKEIKEAGVFTAMWPPGLDFIAEKEISGDGEMPVISRNY